jgi:SET domain-containing protein
MPEPNNSQKKAGLHLAIKRTETGLGLFTLKPIAAGTRIIEYKGPILDEDEAEETGGKYLFELDDEHVIDGRARSNIARYINHACSPNAEERTVGRRIWIWSRRDIEAGEEITIDYGREYFDEFIKPKGCKCSICAPRSAAKAAITSK